MNHFCESRELQRFPAFQKRLEAVMLNFLYDAMKPVEKRSLESIVMEVCLIAFLRCLVCYTLLDVYLQYKEIGRENTINSIE